MLSSAFGLVQVALSVLHVGALIAVVLRAIKSARELAGCLAPLSMALAYGVARFLNERWRLRPWNAGQG